MLPESEESLLGGLTGELVGIVEGSTESVGGSGIPPRSLLRETRWDWVVPRLSPMRMRMGIGGNEVDCRGTRFHLCHWHVGDR